jgi:hypothetical protein
MDAAIAAALSKLEGYTARFALIFQLVSWAAYEKHKNGKRFKKNRIEIRSLRRAIRLSDWFANETRRIYSLFAEGKEEQQQRELVDLIQRRDPVATPSTTPSELRQACRRFRSADEAEIALDALRDAGLGYWRTQKSGNQGGRPARRFWLVTKQQTAVG